MKIQQKSIKRKIKHKHSQYSKNITEKKTHTHTYDIQSQYKTKLI